MRINQLQIILAVIFLSFATLSSRAGVIVESSCDSVAMWIGEQSQIHLSVTCDAGQQVIFPTVGDTLVRGLEVVPPVKTDTQYVDRKKRMTVTRNYTVTSFDSAFFYIPPFEVLVDSMPYSTSNGISLAVYMFDVDTLHMDQFFGPKDIMNQSLEWTDVRPAVCSFLIALIVLAVLILLFVSWKNDKPIIRRVRIEPKKPAHEVAFAEMERIRQSQMAHSEDSKEYYTALTDAVRLYMNERFGFNATEMTSDEIISHLMEVREKDSLRELKELFETSDLVKFAKFRPMLGENDRNLLTAIEFVKETMNNEEPQEQQPQEQVIVESKRSKEARGMLLAGIIVLGIAACAMLFIFFRHIYYLFF